MIEEPKSSEGKAVGMKENLEENGLGEITILRPIDYTIRIISDFEDYEKFSKWHAKYGKDKERMVIEWIICNINLKL